MSFCIKVIEFQFVTTQQQITNMGLFWDLIQQSQIQNQSNRSASLEERVYYLERELDHTRMLLNRTLKVLEEYTGQDIDGDGKAG